MFSAISPSSFICIDLVIMPSCLSLKPHILFSHWHVSLFLFTAVPSPSAELPGCMRRPAAPRHAPPPLLGGAGHWVLRQDRSARPALCMRRGCLRRDGAWDVLRPEAARAMWWHALRADLRARRDACAARFRAVPCGHARLPGDARRGRGFAHSWLLHLHRVSVWSFRGRARRPRGARAEASAKHAAAGRHTGCGHGRAWCSQAEARMNALCVRRTAAPRTNVPPTTPVLRVARRPRWETWRRSCVPEGFRCGSGNTGSGGRGRA